ncbi:unnamed protein product [Toxocara canis]|uniref:Signal peptide-containing protein n=2 Tax=Toxocara canis TaxID=6265 RepID=A0A183UI72_TOXCA|nr:unnamed protein product [Toxocara canis]
MRTTYTWLVITLYCMNRKVDSVWKRQLEVDQFFFPTTASFPESGWDSTVSENTESLYDEIILLPQERKLSSAEQIGESDERVGDLSMVNKHQKDFKQIEPFVAPRTVIERKQDADESEQHLLSLPKKFLRAENSTNSQTRNWNVKTYSSLYDYRQQIPDGNVKQIDALTAGTPESTSRSKNVVTAKAGYGGKVIIDLSGDHSKKHHIIRSAHANGNPNASRKRPVSTSESSESNALSFERSVENIWEQHRLARKIRPTETKSMDDILDNLLLVRKDIVGLRRDLREVKELMHELNRKQNESDPTKIGSELSSESQKNFDFSSGQYLKMNKSFDENSAERSKTVQALFMITKASTITKTDDEEISTNYSANGRLGDLANLTVETAHQVFPILIQPFKSTGNHTSISGSIHRLQPSALITTDSIRNHFVVDNGPESAKHGTLIRLSDESGNIKLQNLANGHNQYSIDNSTSKYITMEDATTERNVKKFDEIRWPFIMDSINFSMDQSTDIVQSSYANPTTTKYASVTSPLKTSLSFSERLFHTVTTKPFNTTTTTNTTQTYTTISQTTKLTNLDDKNLTDRTFMAYALNSSSTLSMTTQMPQSTTLSMERYTYKDPDSVSSNERQQQTTTSPLDRHTSSTVYGLYTTQQPPLWPDVLFQGG